MRKIVGELEAYGRWMAKHIDFADEMGESVLSRCIEYGYTDPSPAGSKILCPDMTSRMQQLHLAVNRLVEPQREAVTLHFCAPVKPDGRLWTTSQLAKLVHMNKGRFRAELNKGIDNLDRVRFTTVKPRVASAIRLRM
ncbi:MAG: hypothetical protein E4G89_05025 [Methanothrix sp.]|nr:MAG: hypothetical protein E4G89_05025 [Methanothrix sp.]